MPKKTYTQISSITLAAASSSVTFSSIPQNFRDLVLVVSGAVTGSQGNNWLFLNGDTSQSNYSFVRMLGDGSSTSSGVNQSGVNGAAVSDMVSSQNQAIVQIMDYSTTDKHKTRLSRSDQPSSTAIAYASRWTNTAAVTSLIFAGGNGGNLASGTTVTLYGIEA
jgi:hypothetical protein